MGVKFYTQFVLAGDPQGPTEYTGLVEVAPQERRPAELKDIAGLLADNLDLDIDDIRILHWSRVH
jgi:hypothetical protein